MVLVLVAVASLVTDCLTVTVVGFLVLQCIYPGVDRRQVGWTAAKRARWGKGGGGLVGFTDTVMYDVRKSLRHTEAVLFTIIMVRYSISQEGGKMGE